MRRFAPAEKLLDVQINGPDRGSGPSVSVWSPRDSAAYQRRHPRLPHRQWPPRLITSRRSNGAIGGGGAAAGIWGGGGTAIAKGGAWRGGGDGGLWGGGGRGGGGGCGPETHG